MIILSPMLENTTSTIFILASFFFWEAWFAKRPRQTFHLCNEHSSFEASINRITYSFRTPENFETVLVGIDVGDYFAVVIHQHVMFLERLQSNQTVKKKSLIEKKN